MAPRRPDSALAVSFSRPLTPLDGSVNAVTDAMNATVPWLWWPLDVPPRDRVMPPGAHVLYVAHAAAGWVAARAVTGRPGPVTATVLAGVTWVLFTGAWDRRARS